jgi:hypothetical protein
MSLRISNVLPVTELGRHPLITRLQLYHYTNLLVNVNFKKLQMICGGEGSLIGLTLSCTFPSKC